MCCAADLSRGRVDWPPAINRQDKADERTRCEFGLRGRLPLLKIDSLDNPALDNRMCAIETVAAQISGLASDGHRPSAKFFRHGI